MKLVRIKHVRLGPSLQASHVIAQVQQVRSYEILIIYLPHLNQLNDSGHERLSFIFLT